MTPRLDAISIITADLPASLAFYRRLGLAVPAGAESAPHVEAVLPGGQRLGLAFLCDGPEEVDALYAELTGAGHTGHLKPWDAVWGQRYAVVLDPDGCGVSLFAPATPATAPAASTGSPGEK
ncbi:MULTISPECIES: VOC family protein [unclassified Streptomyces]|uniref:VOC family protein n=1 Tax=unclassified Streptomyces TaxID=2593676 RepID=UPI0018E3C3D0|nr:MULTISPECIES: VOC family protein [unclassified Streptomyces]